MDGRDAAMGMIHGAYARWFAARQSDAPHPRDDPNNPWRAYYLSEQLDESGKPIWQKPIEASRTPLQYSGSLYRYFDLDEHAASWIDGGPQPLQVESYYRREGHGGIFTPDEVLQYETPSGWSPSADNFGSKPPLGLNIKMVGCTLWGPSGPRVVNGSFRSREEDALILCLSCSASLEIMTSLEKAVCVEIIDVDRLRHSLDDQLGTQSLFGRVNYTSGVQRGHFLKSEGASGQDEYRLAWPAITSATTVTIPPGCARRVDLS